MQANWLWGFDQFIGELTKGSYMKEPKVSIKYVYERIDDILRNSAFVDDMPYKLSEFMDELAHNYKVDTGEDL
jgi:hypothetical protein